MTDAKGDTALNQTIHVHQQVEGSNNTIVGYQSGEASAHVSFNDYFWLRDFITITHFLLIG